MPRWKGNQRGRLTSSAGITVVIPEDADDDMITAGLTAVAALAYRYDDDTPINLALSVPPAESATASQRVVALVAGPAGDVTTAVLPPSDGMRSTVQCGWRDPPPVMTDASVQLGRRS